MTSLKNKFKKKVIKSKAYSEDFRKRSKQFYETKQWKLIRINTLQRNGGLCEHCLKNNIITPAVDVDHIIPHRGNKELFFDLNNLQILCKECHSIKTISETLGVGFGLTGSDLSPVNNNMRLLCCPVGYDYRTHTESDEEVLDEYIICKNLYKDITKENLIAARQNKYKLIDRSKKQVFISFEFSHFKRNEIFKRIKAKESLIILPEKYLINENFEKEANKFLLNITFNDYEKIKKVS